MNKVARKKTFSAREITEAFRQLREKKSMEVGVLFANGDNFTIRSIERDLMDILQPPAGLASQRTVDLNKLADSSLDEFNDALFG